MAPGVNAAPLQRGLYAFVEPGLGVLAQVPQGQVDVLLTAFLRLCGAQALPKDAAACRGKHEHELTDGPLERALNHRLLARKRSEPALTVLMSIGGWGGSDGFFAMAERPQTRAVFVAAVRRFLVEHEAFDGVDLDWEHPGGNGAANGVALGSERDGANYHALLTELRAGLDALGRERGRRYRLSIAINGTRPVLGRMPWAPVAPLLDHVFIMSYDYHGGWNRFTGHHAALGRAQPSADDSLEDSVATLRAAGVPASKLWAGAAFYGRAWAGVTSPQAGAAARGPALTPDGALGWRELQACCAPGRSGFVARWDAQRKAEARWHPKRQIWISLETPTALRAKVAWAREQGLGGVFAWEASQDDGALWRAMRPQP